MWRWGYALTIALCIGQASGELFSREYNIWYRQNGVMYDMTQDEKGSPVFISIGFNAQQGYNLLITREGPAGCAAGSLQHELIIGGVRSVLPALCQQMDGVTIHSISDNTQLAQQMVGALGKGFTVVLDNDVKIWAANFATPKFGMTPRL